MIYYSYSAKYSLCSFRIFCDLNCLWHCKQKIEFEKSGRIFVENITINWSVLFAYWLTHHQIHLGLIDEYCSRYPCAMYIQTIQVLNINSIIEQVMRKNFIQNNFNWPQLNNCIWAIESVFKLRWQKSCSVNES